MVLDLECSNKEVDFCESCAIGKARSLPFPKHSENRASEILEMMHTDVIGPMQTPLEVPNILLLSLMMRRVLYEFVLLLASQKCSKRIKLLYSNLKLPLERNLKSYGLTVVENIFQTNSKDSLKKRALNIWKYSPAPSKLFKGPKTTRSFEWEKFKVEIDLCRGTSRISPWPTALSYLHK